MLIFQLLVVLKLQQLRKCVTLVQLSSLLVPQFTVLLTQLPPLVLSVLGIAGAIAYWVGGGAKSVRALQVIGLLMVLSGAMGVYFHGEENLEHARRDAEEYGEPTSGSSFWMNAIKGDAPTLAPGTMVQFGLLALLFAYRHPALKRPEE